MAQKKDKSLSQRLGEAVLDVVRMGQALGDEDALIADAVRRVRTTPAERPTRRPGAPTDTAYRMSGMVNAGRAVEGERLVKKGNEVLAEVQGRDPQDFYKPQPSPSAARIDTTSAETMADLRRPLTAGVRQVDLSQMRDPAEGFGRTPQGAPTMRGTVGGYERQMYGEERVDVPGGGQMLQQEQPMTYDLPASKPRDFGSNVLAGALPKREEPTYTPAPQGMKLGATAQDVREIDTASENAEIAARKMVEAGYGRSQKVQPDLQERMSAGYDETVQRVGESVLSSYLKQNQYVENEGPIQTEQTIPAMDADSYQEVGESRRQLQRDEDQNLAQIDKQIGDAVGTSANPEVADNAWEKVAGPSQRDTFTDVNPVTGRVVIPGRGKGVTVTPVVRDAQNMLENTKQGLLAKVDQISGAQKAMADENQAEEAQIESARPSASSVFAGMDTGSFVPSEKPGRTVDAPMQAPISMKAARGLGSSFLDGYIGGKAVAETDLNERATPQDQTAVREQVRNMKRRENLRDLFG